MLMPKKVKYRKQQRGRMSGKAKGGTAVSFGEFGLKAMEACWMTNRQIEAARVAMTRYIKRGGKIWIRIFPDKVANTSLPSSSSTLNIVFGKAFKTVALTSSFSCFIKTNYNLAIAFNYPYFLPY